MIRIGIAAHITAASPGGPRYDASLSHDERKAPSNGIWLCDDHARLIDVDPARHTTALLKEWKRIAEQRPLGSPRQGLATYELPVLARELPVGDRHQLAVDVRAWSEDVGLAVAWGQTIAEAVEALVAEIGLNAAMHSDPPAGSIELISEGHELVLAYQGSVYSLEDWRGTASPRGGWTVLDLTLRELSSTLVLTTTHRHGTNAWHFAFNGWPRDGCSWEATRNPDLGDLQRLSGCSVVRLNVGNLTMMLSHPIALLAAFAEVGIRRVAVVDVPNTHFLAPGLQHWADEFGIELSFLGMPAS